MKADTRMPGLSRGPADVVKPRHLKWNGGLLPTLKAGAPLGGERTPYAKALTAGFFFIGQAEPVRRDPN